MIGLRLFRAMSSSLQQRGFSAAALWVLRENLRARRFYERLGGKVFAEREDVRDGATLVELVYGWPDLNQLNRLLARSFLGNLTDDAYGQMIRRGIESLAKKLDATVSNPNRSISA